MSRTLQFLLPALAALTSLYAADDSRIITLTAADDTRISAMQHPDKEKLDAVFSNELHYAHSTGVVDTKASYMDALITGRTKYISYVHEERTFTFPEPDIALMTGRAKVKAVTAAGEMESALSYLAVWRNEQGRWRFLAWQSCKLPPAATR